MENDKWGDETNYIVMTEDQSEVYETYDGILQCLVDEGIIGSDELSKYEDQGRDPLDEKVYLWYSENFPDDYQLDNIDRSTTFNQVKTAIAHNMNPEVVICDYGVGEGTLDQQVIDRIVDHLHKIETKQARLQEKMALREYRMPTELAISVKGVEGIDINNTEELGNYIADLLADRYGYCVYAFDWDQDDEDPEFVYVYHIEWDIDESLEGDKLANDSIQQSNDDYEKDRQAERDAKVEFAKNGRQPLNENEKLSEDALGIARYLYDELYDGEITKDFSDVMEEYDGDASLLDYKKAVRLIQGVLDSGVKYYNDDLELSDRKVMFDIHTDIDPLDYWDDADQWLVQFDIDNNTDTHYAGRGNRHIIIEDNFDNFIRYPQLRDKMRELQDAFVEYMNNKDTSEDEVEQ